MPKKFLIILLISKLILSSVEEVEEDEKNLDKDTKFARRVLRGFYGGPEYADDYEDLRSNKPMKLEKNIKHCYNKILNEPKIISLYDQYFCQGFAMNKTTRNMGLKFHLRNSCGVNNNTDPNEKSFAFCEGFDEYSDRRIIV